MACVSGVREGRRRLGSIARRDARRTVRRGLGPSMAFSTAARTAISAASSSPRGLATRRQGLLKDR